MRLVVDASIALQVLLAGTIGPLDRHTLHAPSLMPSEVTSALRELVWRGDVPGAVARQALARLASLNVTHAPPGSLAEAATVVATDLGWAKTYGAEYVALAGQLECPLLTLDERLRRRIGSRVDVLGPLDL